MARLMRNERSRKQEYRKQETMSRARRPIAMPRSLFSNCSNISHFTGLLISRHALPRTATVGEHGNHGNQYPRDQRKPTSWLTGSIVIDNTWLVEKNLPKKTVKTVTHTQKKLEKNRESPTKLLPSTLPQASSEI